LIMETSIWVEGIECYSYHGCLDEESVIGGWYIVDVHIRCDLTASMESDNLSDTVDYVMVSDVVQTEMAVRSKLIEHAGSRIIQNLASKIYGRKSIELKIKKIKPPVNANVSSATFICSENFDS